MQKDLIKLALAGLAAGLCISAQSGMGREIAMTKCSKSPTQNQGQSSCSGQQDQSSCSGSQGCGSSGKKQQKNNSMDNGQSSCGSSSDSGSCGSSSDSNACNGQGDQSSQGEKIREAKKVEVKRLSAAKAAVEEG